MSKDVFDTDGIGDEDHWFAWLALCEPEAAQLTLLYDKGMVSETTYRERMRRLLRAAWSRRKRKEGIDPFEDRKEGEGERVV